MRRPFAASPSFAPPIVEPFGTSAHHVCVAASPSFAPPVCGSHRRFGSGPQVPHQRSSFCWEGGGGGPLGTLCPPPPIQARLFRNLHVRPCPEPFAPMGPFSAQCALPPCRHTPIALLWPLGLGASPSLYVQLAGVEPELVQGSIDPDPPPRQPTRECPRRKRTPNDEHTKLQKQGAWLRWSAWVHIIGHTIVCGSRFRFVRRHGQYRGGLLLDIFGEGRAVYHHWYCCESSCDPSVPKMATQYSPCRRSRRQWEPHIIVCAIMYTSLRLLRVLPLGTLAYSWLGVRLHSGRSAALGVGVLGLGAVRSSLRRNPLNRLPIGHTRRGDARRPMGQRSAIGVRRYGGSVHVNISRV